MKKLSFFCLLLLMYTSRVFCQYDSLKPQGIYESNFIIDEVPRNLTYYMPLNYGKLENYPLLIVLHDEKSSAKNVIQSYNSILHKKADSLNCVVMYPDAVAGHWKGLQPAASADSLNDISFISIMLQYFVQQYHCDPKRIYILGIGKGGAVAYHINCRIPGKMTAISTINMPEGDVPGCSGPVNVPALALTPNQNIKAGIGRAILFLFSH